MGYAEYCDPVYARPGPGWRPPCGGQALQAGTGHWSTPTNRAISGQFPDMRSCVARSDLGG